MNTKQMSRRTFLSWSTTLAAGMAVSGCGSAATPAPTATPMPVVTEAVTDSQVIKLVTGEYPPYTGEKLPEQGAASEIMKLIFAKMGREVKIDFKPWVRASEETLAANYFGTFPWSSNEERRQQFLFSENIIPDRIHFFTKADSTFEFTNLEQLTGHTICSPKGWNTYTLDKMIEAGKIKMEEPDDLESCLQMIKAGRAEMTFNGELVTWHVIKQLFGDTKDFKALPKPLTEAGNYLLVSKKYPDSEKLLAEFNQALAELNKEGKIEAILKKYAE